MMNFVALFLIVSSLASAGMWSPSPTDNQKQKQGDHHHREVIVKNGHRVVVVEYDEYGHPNTKVSISPEQQDNHYQAHKDSSSISNNDVSLPSRVSRSFDNAMENIKEASSSVFPNLGEGHNPKELICDAYGKCKETIASVIETKKDIMKETAHGAKEAAVKVGEVVGKAKETVSDKAENLYEKVKDKAENVYETAKDKAENAYEKGKETASDTAREAEETSKESIEKAKSAAETAKATGDTLAGDIKRNVTGKAKEAKETAEQAAEKVKAGAEELKSGTQKWFHQLDHRVKEIWNNAFGSVRLSGVVDSLMSVVQLFGLGTAYGMSMWITFISSHVLAGNLAPQQFGMVQSKIYKVYFRAMAYCVGTVLLGQLWRQRNNIFSGNAAHVLQNYNLMAGLLGILVNMLFLEPQSTKAMLERMKMEKEEGRGRERGQVGSRTTREAVQELNRTEAESSVIIPSQVPERREQEGVQSHVARLEEMRQRLKHLNTYSSFLNIMSLMGLSWHLVYLAQRLHGSCC